MTDQPKADPGLEVGGTTHKPPNQPNLPEGVALYLPTTLGLMQPTRLPNGWLCWDDLPAILAAAAGEERERLLGGQAEIPLITVWAEHEDDHGIYDPQFVAAFPVSLSEAMHALYVEWLQNACQQYVDEVDSPVRALLCGRATIGRPDRRQLEYLDPDDPMYGIKKWDAALDSVMKGGE